MVMAHGGSKDIVSTQRKGGLILSGILKDTTANSPKAVHMRSLETLVAQTTGVPREKPVMEGVLTATVPANRRDAPELMPNHSMNKSASKMAVGASYAGDKSGYAAAQHPGGKKKSSASKYK